MGETVAALAQELNQPCTAALTYLHASPADLKRAGLIGQSASLTIELANTQLLRAVEIIRRTRKLLAYETRSLGMERVADQPDGRRGVFLLSDRRSGA